VKQKTKASADEKLKFVKATISIPSDVAKFAARRKNEPAHAGNLSSYIRALIIADNQVQQEKASA